MATYSQTTRAVRIKSPLGDDRIHFLGLEGTEAISELFEFRIEVRVPGEQRSLNYDDLLGQSIVLSIRTGGCPLRYLAGIVAELAEVGRDSTGIRYRFLLVPSVWTLGLGRRFRIFQQQTVPRILRIALGGVETRFELSAQYPKHNTCVQYDESDFQFASRLMEEEGIYYYFEHTADGDRLVLADTSSNAPKLSETDEIQYGIEGSGEREEGRVHQWRKTQRLVVGKCQVRDFCFQRSNKPIAADASLVEEITIGTSSHRLDVGGTRKRQDMVFPGRFVHRFDGIGPLGSDQSSELNSIDGDAKRTAKLRMEAKGGSAVECGGESDCGHLTPGYRFKLHGHFHGDGDYLVTRLNHRLEAPDFRSGSSSTGSYENTFSAIPISLPFRPPLVTPRPVARGAQTAIVLGLGDDPIQTDKYGRVKVRFHWEPDATSDSSAWIRVAQAWAGSGWGMVNIPRANQEVVVDFLDGDPDCPIIVGSIYNHENMPPFELPTYKTLAGIKTDSQLSGETTSFNGLSFNDKDGQEEVHLRAQKDMVLFVKNNHLASINGQNFEHTGGIRFKSVGGFPLPTGSGSGSGGGDAGDIADEAVGWGWGMAKKKLGQDYATNIGVEARKGVGRCTTAVYGGGSSTIVDPIAWSDEFAIPVKRQLASVMGLILGTGREDVVYGQFVDLSYGARFRAHRGPLYEFAGSGATGKFPTRILTAVQPLPTIIALIVEEILSAVKKNNVDILVGINAGALLLQAGMGWYRKRAERILFRTLEAALKTSDGSADAMKNLLGVPNSYCRKTNDTLLDVKTKNAEEAAKDLVFQEEPSENRAAHRVIVDGPYSVKSSGMLELATYSEMSAGASRINLADNTALLSADSVVSVMGGTDSLIEVGSGINAFGGANGAVRVGSGLTANKRGAASQAQFTPTDLSLSVGPGGKNPSQINMTAASIKIQVGSPNACGIAMDGTSITLTCGKNSLKIDPSGVTVTGTLIKLNGQSGIQHTSPLVKIGG